MPLIEKAKSYCLFLGNITEEPFLGRRLREVQAQYIPPDSLSDVHGATHNVHVFQVNFINDYSWIEALNFFSNLSV